MHRSRAFVSSKVSDWLGPKPVNRTPAYIPMQAFGGTISTTVINGIVYRTHTYGSSGGTFAVANLNDHDGSIEYIVETDGTNNALTDGLTPWTDLSTAQSYDGLLLRLVNSNDAFSYTSTTGSFATNTAVAAIRASSNDSGLVTFFGAIDHSESFGGRLPTLEEAMNNGLKGSGSGYDAELIWTCTHAGDPDYHYVVQGRDPFDNLGGPVLLANTSTAYVRNASDLNTSRTDPVILNDSVLKTYMETNHRTLTTSQGPVVSNETAYVVAFDSTNSIPNIGPLAADNHGLNGNGRIIIRYPITQ